MGQQKPDEVAIWKKQDKNGKVFLSVFATINGQNHSFVCFGNNKSNDKQPDFKSAPKRELPTNTMIPTVPDPKTMTEDDLPF